MSKEKITNANSFPKDWPIKKLADIGSTYGGLTNKSKEDFAEGNSKFITYKNIYNNTFINTNELESVRIYKDEKQNKVKYGDVFFTGSSETPDEVGISSVLLEEVDDVYLNSFCFGFRFNDLKKTIPEFYGYYFRGPVFRNEVYPLAQGSTRFNLSKSEMVKLKVPVPPVKEQYKIAAILSSVDEAIEKTEAIIEQTEKVKKGLMQQLLTKGIGHTKFKKTEIGEIPEEWELKKVEEVFYEVRDTSNNLELYPLYSLTIEEGLVPKPDRYERSFLLKNKEENQYRLVYPQNILFNPMNLRFGAIAISKERVPVSVSAYYNVLSTVNDNYLAEYYAYLFCSGLYISLYERIATGSLIEKKRVHLSQFFKISVPVPPKDEQKKIVEIISSIENKIQNEKQRLNQLQMTKKALMQVLLTGKVRVKVDNEVMSQ
ncbi:restriction endonuclease subunit S [Anoxybacillus kestanbolensis]|uniref:restriction endonuclease subunit S n=1 Tax=Anoxybacillus kestanbolensis TaxID=227476 RepID=UPI003D20727E